MAKMIFCPLCKEEHEKKWIISRPIGFTCVIHWQNRCREMASKMENSPTFLKYIDAEYDRTFGKEKKKNAP